MRIETELKFPVSNFGPVIERLRHISTDHTPWYYEHNIILDDDKGTLKNKDILLRLRTGLNSKLTLKLPLEGNSSGLAKKRQEFETSLDNIKEVESIFSILGFGAWLRYEKCRQVWKLDKVRICLDVLPFGRFVEVEGPEELIIEAVFELGLDLSRATARTYHELNRDYIAQNSLEPSEDFVFDPLELKAFARELGISMNILKE
jgi:adenylate cyclase, class 2